MQDFTFPDFKNPSALLDSELSLSRFSEKMLKYLLEMSAAFEVAASNKTTWPEEIDFLQDHAEWYAQHSKMLADWAAQCDNDHTLHILREQINGFIVEVSKFLADLKCMEMSDHHGSFDQSKWDWRVRKECEWCAFAEIIDKSRRKLEEVTRAIDWRIRALLEMNPKKNQGEIQSLEQHKRKVNRDAQQNRLRAKRR